MTMQTEDLRKLRCVECGDKDPDCEGLVLSPGCHKGRGVEIALKDNLVGIHCKTCHRHVAALEAPEPIELEGVLQANCHQSGVFATYKKAVHWLVLTCAACNEPVGTLKLPSTLN